MIGRCLGETRCTAFGDGLDHRPPDAMIWAQALQGIRHLSCLVHGDHEVEE